VGGQRAPERRVHHHQRRGKAEQPECRDGLGLQRRRHVQQPLHQQRHEAEGQRRDDGAQRRQRGDGGAGKLRRALPLAGADALGQRPRQRRADAEVENPEHAHQRQREGEEAPALDPHLVHQDRGEGEGEQQGQPAPEGIPERPGQQPPTGGAPFGRIGHDLRHLFEMPVRRIRAGPILSGGDDQ
jgi:hypothetical protein